MIEEKKSSEKVFAAASPEEFEIGKAKVLESIGKLTVDDEIIVAIKKKKRDDNKIPFEMFIMGEMLGLPIICHTHKVLEERIRANGPQLILALLTGSMKKKVVKDDAGPSDKIFDEILDLIQKKTT